MVGLKYVILQKRKKKGGYKPLFSATTHRHLYLFVSVSFSLDKLYPF